MASRRSFATMTDRDYGDWKVAVVGDSLHVYWRSESMPRYTFRRRDGCPPWRGYDQSFPSMSRAVAWVRSREER